MIENYDNLYITTGIFTLEGIIKTKINRTNHLKLRSFGSRNDKRHFKGPHHRHIMIENDDNSYVTRGLCTL